MTVPGLSIMQAAEIEELLFTYGHDCSILQDPWKRTRAAETVTKEILRVIKEGQR